MFKSLILDQFYSGDGSFATDANSTIEQFSTPLKKLPDSSINELKNDLHLHPQNPLGDVPENSEPINRQNLRSQQYQLISNSTSLAPSLSFSSSLQPLSEVPAKLNALGNSGSLALFSQKPDAESNRNGAVFYKPLTIEGPILSKSYIPPPLQQSARNPIIVSQSPEGKFNNELDDDGDLSDVIDAPTGDWTSPVVIQALRRQVNKEKIFRSVWKNILRLAFFHLALLFAAYLHLLYQIRFHDENAPYRNDTWSQWHRLAAYKQLSDYVISTSQFLHHLQWIFILKIVFGVLRLLRPQDQCTDLPLTNKQRKLIGLKPRTSGDDNEDLKSDLVMKERLFESAEKRPVKLPKYKKLTDFSGQVHRHQKLEQDEPSIALANVLPTGRLIHSAPAQANGVKKRNGDYGFYKQGFSI